jgi:hypothetical protein
VAVTLRVEINPYHDAGRRVLEDVDRVRFHMGGKHVDVYVKHERLVIHADGFHGGMKVYPRVSNEIEVEP